MLSATTPRVIISDFRGVSDGDERHYGFQIPVTSQVSVHTVKLSMKWNNRLIGGNIKGRVFVVSEDEHEPYDRSSRVEDFSEGSLVYASAAPTTARSKLTISFRPKKNKTYHLWYIGGGTRDGLQLIDITVQYLVFDDQSRCFREACDFLYYSNDATSGPLDSLGFAYHDTMSLYLETILETTMHALVNGLQIPPPIVSFFHNCGVYSGALTQKLIATIISVRKDRVQEFASFNQNSKEGDRPADHSHAYGEYAGAYDPDFLDFDEYFDESSYDSSLNEN